MQKKASNLLPAVRTPARVPQDQRINDTHHGDANSRACLCLGREKNDLSDDFGFRKERVVPSAMRKFVVVGQI
jgi:hypothetical protein